MKDKVVSAVLDSRRDTLFKIGDRVHWYEYSSDAVIMNGGYGIVIEIFKREWSYGETIPFLHVLKDGLAVLVEFPIHDCDLEENWIE